MKTILLVGLGNPGKKYARTRHNAGFMFVDYFWKTYQEAFAFLNWEFKKNLNAEISLGKIKSSQDQVFNSPQEQVFNLLRLFEKSGVGYKPAPALRIILLKPQTFMNLSGEAVQKTLRFYKLKPENLIVAHDDIDLALGKYKISFGSSSAGHNGVQNIIEQLGTKNFTRLRIGIENRGDKKIPTEKYVLGKFTEAEQKKIKTVFKNF